MEILRTYRMAYGTFQEGSRKYRFFLLWIIIWNASFQVFLRNGYVAHCLEYVVCERKNSQVCLVSLKMTWSTEVKAEIFYAHNGKIYAKSPQIQLEIALSGPQ